MKREILQRGKKTINDMAIVDFSPINVQIRSWEQKTLAAIKQRARSLGVSHRANSSSNSDSVQAMKVKDSKSRGDLISSISFTFARHLIYVVYGAGRGRGGAKGSSWIGPHGIRRKTNPKSLGKAGSGGRVAKPFFDVINDASLGELADTVTAKTGDVIVANIFSETKTGKL